MNQRYEEINQNGTMKGGKTGIILKRNGMTSNKDQKNGMMITTSGTMKKRRPQRKMDQRKRKHHHQKKKSENHQKRNTPHHLRPSKKTSRQSKRPWIKRNRRPKTSYRWCKVIKNFGCGDQCVKGSKEKGGPRSEGLVGRSEDESSGDRRTTRSNWWIRSNKVWRLAS